VAGWTIIKPRRQSTHKRDNTIQSKRSAGQKQGRRVPVRRSSKLMVQDD
jgi:hypothetical protein